MERVLVVDDEFAVREILGTALEACGYRAVKAADGAEGLQIFRERSDEIRVVLSDMNMPVMKGDAMVREIRRLKPSVGVISTSGSGPEADRWMRSIDRSVPLAKPYTLEELATAVKAAIAVSST